MNVSGTINSSGQVPLDLQGSSHVFSCKNLGLLKFLTLSCSFTSKVYVDFVIIRNEETGHVFKFLCNHWFGRNVEDDAMERILLARHVNTYADITDLIKKSQNRTSSIGRHFSRGIGFIETRKDMPLEKLQYMLKNQVEQLVRTCSRLENDETIEIIMDSSGKTNQVKPSNGTEPSSSGKKSTQQHNQQLNELIFSEPDGVVYLLKQCLCTGLRNRTKSPFRKQIFLWDYILRIQMELKLSWKTLDSHLSSVKNDSTMSPSRKKIASRTDRKFIEIVDNINSLAVFWGKDAKLCLLLTIALRDRLLSPHLLRLLSWPSLAKQFFEPTSFVTDQSLMMFLIQVMSNTNQVDIIIDSAATKGI